MACLWYFVGSLHASPEDYADADVDSWIQNYAWAAHSSSDDPDDVAVQNEMALPLPRDNAWYRERYIASVYWAFTTQVHKHVL